MANQEHLDILKQGAKVWNKWRREHPEIQIDLSGADLSGIHLRGINLRQTNLRGAILREANLSEAFLRYASLIDADLSKAKLRRASLTGANLTGANLSEADLSEAELWRTNLSDANLRRAILRKANLSEADLHYSYLGGANLCEACLREANLWSTNLSTVNFAKADLYRANLHGADLRASDFSEASLSEAELNEADLTYTNLSGADLSGADLSAARIVSTKLIGANLTNCSVWGIAAWEVQLQGAIQSNLVITLPGHPTVTVDNLEIAQFIYLLLNNAKIRDIIDTITSKVVLILGRFSKEQKSVLNVIKDALRKQKYVPVMFDFDPPKSRDVTETITILARMSRFIIADITDPRSIPQELASIVPDLPSVPVQPIIHSSQREYGMFEHFTNYPWVQPVYRYYDMDDLLDSIQEHIIDPAEKKVRELAIEKAKKLERT
jgi:uncharacterized protein YjbI with pentapeptide repeats